MPEAVATALLNAGILGPIVIAVGYYVLKLHDDLRNLNEKRVADAQAVTQKLLELADRINEDGREQGQINVQVLRAVEDMQALLRETQRGPRR